MHKRQVINLKIEDMEFPAKGTGTFEGVPVHVKNGLIGQTLQVRISKNRKEYSEAKVVVKKVDANYEELINAFLNCAQSVGFSKDGLIDFIKKEY